MRKCVSSGFGGAPGLPPGIPPPASSAAPLSPSMSSRRPSAPTSNYVKLPDKPKIQYELLSQVTQKVQYEILPPTAQQMQKVVYDNSMPLTPGGGGMPYTPDFGSPFPGRTPPPKPAKPVGGLPPPMSAPPAAPAEKKNKQCQRCDVNKAAQKVTITTIVLKLCAACTDIVQSDPLEAVAAVEKGTGVKLEIKKSEPPVTYCERCKKRPAHGRFTFDGKPTLCCQTCFTEHPDHIQMTKYAAACIYHKDYDEARNAFLELIKMTPNHGNTLFNLACVESLCGNKDEGFALLVRALENGYNNWKMVAGDDDLAVVRSHPEFNAAVAKWQAEDKANRGPGAGQRLMTALVKAKETVVQKAKSTRQDGDGNASNSLVSSDGNAPLSTSNEFSQIEASGNFGQYGADNGMSNNFGPGPAMSNNFGPGPAMSNNFGPGGAMSSNNFGPGGAMGNNMSPPTVRARAPTAPNLFASQQQGPPFSSRPPAVPGSPPVLSPRTSSSRILPPMPTFSGGAGAGGPPPTLSRSFSGDVMPPAPRPNGGPPMLSPRGSASSLAPRPNAGGPPPGRALVSPQGGAPAFSIFPVMSSAGGGGNGGGGPSQQAPFGTNSGGGGGGDGPRVPSQAEYAHQPYWHGDFNRTVAENHLAALHVGAFVLRPSSQFGCLSLSHRKADGTIGHALVHMHTGQTLRLGWSIEDEDDDYPSLHDLLLSLDKLKYP